MMYGQKEAYEEMNKTWNQNSKTASDTMLEALGKQTLEEPTKDYVYGVLSSFVDVRDNDRTPSVS